MLLSARFRDRQGGIVKCPERGSNPHSRRKGILSPLCLPIPPSGLALAHNLLSVLVGVALVALPACGVGLRGGGERLSSMMSQADAAWLLRGRAGFGPTRDVLSRASEVLPGHPEIGWRWVRLRVGEGLAAANRREAIRAFSEARDMGVACLDGDLSFRERRIEFGWEDALRMVDEDHAGCVLWTATAWTRWMEQVGGASSALDAPHVGALLARAQALIPAVDRSRVRWTRGIFQAVVPEDLGGDREAAKQALSSGKDDALVRAVDRILLVSLPDTDGEITPALADEISTWIQQTARTPEERRAKERITALGESTP